MGGRVPDFRGGCSRLLGWEALPTQSRVSNPLLKARRAFALAAIRAVNFPDLSVACVGHL